MNPHHPTVTGSTGGVQNSGSNNNNHSTTAYSHFNKAHGGNHAIRTPSDDSTSSAAAVALRGASKAWKYERSSDSVGQGHGPPYQVLGHGGVVGLHRLQTPASSIDQDALTAATSADRNHSPARSVASASRGTPVGPASPAVAVSRNVTGNSNASYKHSHYQQQHQNQYHHYSQPHLEIDSKDLQLQNHPHNQHQHQHQHQAYPNPSLVAARLHQFGSPTANTGLSVVSSPTTPGGPKQFDARSASLIAATLAASRSASPNHNAKTIAAAQHPEVFTPTLRRRGSLDTMSSSASSPNSDAASATVDSLSIAPTGSLIHMYEKARGGGGVGGGGDPKMASKRPSPPQSISSSANGEIRTLPKSPKTKSKPEKQNRLPTPPPTRTSDPDIVKTKRRPSPPPTKSFAQSLPAIVSTKVSDKKPKPLPSSSKPSTGSGLEPTSQMLGSAAPPNQQSAPKATRPKHDAQGDSTVALSKPRPPPKQPSTPTLIPNNKEQTQVRTDRNTTTPAPLGRNSNQNTGPASVPASTSPRQKPISQHTQPSQPSSGPPSLKRLMSTEGVTNTTKNPTQSSLSHSKSPYLTLNPAMQSAEPPPPDPLKRSSTTRQQPPTPPKPRGTAKPIQEQNTGRGRASETAEAREKGLPALNREGPLRSKERSAPPPPIRRTDTQNNPPLPSRHKPVKSVSSSPTREVPLPRRRATNNTSNTTGLQLGSLADAIVAGSLASARVTPHNTGPPTIPPELPKRQRSPPKLLQTLRQPITQSDEDADRHKKNHHHPKLRKGKHAHHEGSRRKWREEITERERKRYEALWASNRGMLLTTQTRTPDASPDRSDEHDLSQYVANVVVREIWKRSRLPADELAEIWELVDREGMGILTRQEFVVGTWLVDQRLKGRKVPAKVTDSVWGSCNGILVKTPRAR